MRLPETLADFEDYKRPSPPKLQENNLQVNNEAATKHTRINLNLKNDLSFEDEDVEREFQGALLVQRQVLDLALAAGAIINILFFVVSTSMVSQNERS